MGSVSDDLTLRRRARIENLQGQYRPSYVNHTVSKDFQLEAQWDSDSGGSMPLDYDTPRYREGEGPGITYIFPS